MPEITVIVPVFNAEKTLIKCLDSIYSQDYSSYEVILVDDCSTDSSRDIAKEYSCRLIELKKNSGSGKARNTGAYHATAPILAFTDSDCIVPKNWLSKIVNDFKKNKVDFVCGGYSGSAGRSYLEKYAFYELLVRRKNLSNKVTSFPSNNFACYKDIFLKEKGFPELKNYFAEDLEFSLEMGQKYNLFWDRTVGITHHFHTSLKKYIKQQFKFARDTVLLYFRKPYLRNIKTYQDEKNKFVILYTFLLIISLIFSLFYQPALYLLFLLPIIILFDSNFLAFIYKKEGIVFSIKSIGLIFLRDITWTLGIIRGFFKFFVL